MHAEKLRPELPIKIKILNLKTVFKNVYFFLRILCANVHRPPVSNNLWYKEKKEFV